MNDIRAKEIVEPIPTRALTPFGLVRLEVEGAFDHDGDPIIRATAQYRPRAPKLQPRVFLDAVVQAMNELAREGDNRFVHVRHVYAGGKPVMDDFAPPKKTRRKAAAR